MSKFGSIVFVLFGIHIFCVHSMDQYIHESGGKQVQTSFHNVSPEYVAEILAAVKKVAASKDSGMPVDIRPVEAAILSQARISLGEGSKKQPVKHDPPYDPYTGCDY